MTPLALAHRAGRVTFDRQTHAAAPDTHFSAAALQLQTTSAGPSLLPRRVVAEMCMGVNQSKAGPDLGTVPSADLAILARGIE
jgi:hypothetical protein